MRLHNRAVLGLACALALCTSTTARADSFLGVTWAAVGFDTHPGLVFTITDGPGGSFVVTSTISGQGPYDGADDVYVGVINNSTRTVNSMVVSGQAGPIGVGIFGFDGDGIASPTLGGPNGHLASNPQDTSFGLYGGPGSFFSNIAANLGSGTVNFIGGIAPGGGHQVFSLEALPSVVGGIGGGGVNATTPVPAGLVMAGMGALSLLGYGWRRRQPRAA
jgi:hypothetical protein